jgi:hypothetical protein
MNPVSMQAPGATAFSNSVTLNGSAHQSDASGNPSVQPRHVAEMIKMGCQLRSSGLPA